MQGKQASIILPNKTQSSPMTMRKTAVPLDENQVNQEISMHLGLSHPSHKKVSVISPFIESLREKVEHNQQSKPSSEYEF